MAPGKPKEPKVLRVRKEQPPDRALKARARKILDRLERAHPDARIYLDFESPFQLLIATILSAQCTDEQVNKITPGLFAKYPDAAAFAAATEAQIQKAITGIGLFRRKSHSISEACKVIAQEHAGRVPDDPQALVSITGVGRKTANCVLSGAFGRPAIAVDTHVYRVSRRLGIATAKTADVVEKDLMAVIPESRWSRATKLLGTHGRRICTAKKPDCEHCPVNTLCDYYAELQIA